MIPILGIIENNKLIDIKDINDFFFFIKILKKKNE